MIDANSHEAKCYRENYRKKINDRFVLNKKSKAELLNTLDMQERTSDKEKEIDKIYKDDIKKFVDELKSDENFAIYKEKYHEDIQEIRNLLYDVINTDDKKWFERKGERIKELFPEAKRIAFEWSSRQWNAFVRQFWKNMRKLKKTDKEKVLGSLTTIFASKENLQKAYKEFVTGFKAIDMSDKIEATVMALICIIGTKEFLWGDRAFTMVLWMIWMWVSIYWIQENFREIFIKNASTNEVEKILQSHQYDHHNDLPIKKTVVKSK